MIITKIILYYIIFLQKPSNPLQFSSKIDDTILEMLKYSRISGREDRDLQIKC